MIWSRDISSAPRGRTVDNRVKMKDGYRTIQAFERDLVILASKCGKVTLSYWIPDEERWCMFMKGEEPVAWMPWPEWPGAEYVERQLRPDHGVAF